VSAEHDDRKRAVTTLLGRVRQGDRVATDELLPLVYEELRQLAAAQLAQERPGHTLQATALAHEAYLRLVGPEGGAGGGGGWENRAHFFGAASRAIRHILVDHARARGRSKRGGGAQVQALPDDSGALAPIAAAPSVDVIALDEALERLASLDPAKARLVEMRFFGGLTVGEAAEALGISESTAAREWQFARAWLFRQLRDEDAGPSGEEGEEIGGGGGGAA
jgi:RNA polymerase sigma factor (TIGR02999 family)